MQTTFTLLPIRDAVRPHCKKKARNSLPPNIQDPSLSCQAYLVTAKDLLDSITYDRGASAFELAPQKCCYIHIAYIYTYIHTYLLTYLLTKRPSWPCQIPTERKCWSSASEQKQYWRFSASRKHTKSYFRTHSRRAFWWVIIPRKSFPRKFPSSCGWWRHCWTVHSPTIRYAVVCRKFILSA